MDETFQKLFSHIVYFHIKKVWKFLSVKIIVSKKSLPIYQVLIRVELNHKQYLLFISNSTWMYSALGLHFHCKKGKYSLELYFLCVVYIETRNYFLGTTFFHWKHPCRIRHGWGYCQSFYIKLSVCAKHSHINRYTYILFICSVTK